ncbi:DUF1496 domain-containing protein [Pseudoalteromonas sp. SSDWG2]|uniref:DUF1496 domain-containing protein n=1 Tax=Pseudoalteromonas sp. SSDWG2 TaxID=3139391 RepID=UPI003BA8BC7E
MRNKMLLGLALLTSLQVHANNSNKSEHLIVGVSPATSAAHLCWYNEQRFSEGAIIEMHKTAKICALKHPNQANGPLMWRSLDAKGQPIYPELKSKIQVR